RTLLAQHCDVAVHSVNTFIVGEHGDSQVPAWSQAAIGGVPVRDWSPPGRAPLDEQALERIAHEVITAAEQIIRGKGRPTTPSAFQPPGSSRPSWTTSAASCRSRRCSPASTASMTCACRCRRLSMTRVST
ncbi:MAG: hypothetical protein JOY89_08695, partial [Solirubrobacterales bacterium]|nr:hypothetical protein [Solirubrobacterales bacterium]